MNHLTGDNNNNSEPPTFIRYSASALGSGSTSTPATWPASVFANNNDASSGKARASLSTVGNGNEVKRINWNVPRGELTWGYRGKLPTWRGPQES